VIIKEISSTNLNFLFSFCGFGLRLGLQAERSSTGAGELLSRAGLDLFFSQWLPADQTLLEVILVAQVNRATHNVICLALLSSGKVVRKQAAFAARL
jgi:hypothetical protein